ncbi:hypothetical protein RD110_13365 [Rhodoferax koreense]|uniref:Diguanylate phosphodiesterase n=1 Tax=Rhodoferax koreensis TaxID=1842727 RepID=A0A1P8K3V8_9BURK|nr:hypothetical protein RD110_13365 [Rhodoferax koreense]
MPWLVLLLSAALSGLLIAHLEESRLQRERNRVTALVGDHAVAIQTLVERALSSTQALAEMVRQRRGAIDDFDRVATEMMPLYPGASILGLAPGGVVRYVVPKAGNERSIGFDLFKDPVQKKDAFAALESGELTLAGPLNLVQGGLGAVGRQPIYLPDGEGRLAFWGFAYVVIRFPQALEGARLAQLVEQGVDYELWRVHPDTQSKQLIAASPTHTLIDPVGRTVHPPGGLWVLSGAPTHGWSDPAGLATQSAMALAVCLLLAYLTKLLATLRAQGRGLEALVTERTSEIFATQNRLQATLDAIPDLIFELGLDGTCHDFRAPAGEFGTAQRGRLVGRRADQVLPAAAAQTVLAALAQALRHGRSEGHQIEVTRPGDARASWFEFSVAHKRDAQESAGGEPRFIVLARDITKPKQAESDLRVAATAFDAQQGMAITGTDKLIVRVNPSFTAITGYSAQDAIGRSLNFLNSGRHESAFYEKMWATVTATGAWRGEVWNRRKNGEIYPDMRTVTAVRAEDGAITHYVNTFADFSERKATEDEIRNLAFYDALTQLPNRRLLLDRLRQSLLASARNHHCGALQFIDLDNFKTLNDTLGHDMGDLLLQQVAERLSLSVREADTVARLGGDEFVVMIEGLDPLREAAAAQARLLGDKILAALNLPYALAGREYHITPSIGVAIYSGSHETTDEVLKHADLAMYQAKAAGRNALRFFNPGMQAAVNARVSLESDIRRGLVEQQFTLHYQPQIDGSGRTVGAEALLRWQHPERGAISPAEFIPVAEETGLILPLGEWVLKTACAQLKAWSAYAATRALTLSVNVSARQFRQQDFAEHVLALVRSMEADTGACRLKIELTESLLLNDVEDTIAKMNLLKAHGVGFSLDDFGTGYSSLSYLKRLPLDQLKIDQSFVRDLLTDANDAAIARTVIALGHSLGLAVIAEGVETEAQRAFLSTQGCDGYQGYLFSRPLPAAAFDAWQRGRTGPDHAQPAVFFEI